MRTGASAPAVCIQDTFTEVREHPAVSYSLSVSIHQKLALAHTRTRTRTHTHSLKEERDMLQQGYIWTESWSFSLTHIPLIVASVMSCGVSSPPHTQMSTVMNITRQHPHRTAPYRLHSQPSSVGAVLPLHCTSGHQHSRTIIALWTTSSSSSAF